MKKRKLWFWGSLVVLISAVFLLITASPLLTISLSENSNVPLGTFITWFGFISLPFTLYFGLHGLREPEGKWDTFLSDVLKGFIILALLWAPLCYLLAGNISYSFTERSEFQGGQLAMQIFWYFSYFMAAGPLLLLLIYGISSLFKRKNKK